MPTRRLRLVVARNRGRDRFLSRIRAHASLMLDSIAAEAPLQRLRLPRTAPSRLRSVAACLDEALTLLQASIGEARAAGRALEAVVQGSGEAVLLLEGGRIRVASPAACACLGVDPGVLRGCDWATALAGFEAQDEDGRRLQPLEVLTEVMEGPIEVCLSTDEGDDRWAELRATPIGTDRQTVLVKVRDLSEERRVAAAREELLSLVTHDLKAPLSVVRGYLELLGRDLGERPRQRAVASGLRNLSRIEELLEDLAAMAVAEEPLAPREMSLVDLNALVEECLEAAGDRLVSVKNTASIRVRGDEHRLRQALVNLVTNAAKFSPPGSPLKVEIRGDGTKAVFTLSNDGPGVRPEERDRAFARSVRLENSEGTEGSGLGLYIARTVIEAHAGVVSLETGPTGSGTRVVVELPMADGASEQVCEIEDRTRHSSQEPEPDGGGYRTSSE